MSFSGDEPGSLLGPLMGRSTTFVMEGREANLRFAQMVVDAVSVGGSDYAVLDLDAVYSSNADRVLSGDHTGRSLIRVPPPGADIERELGWLFLTAQRVIIIDSLNSLYHLLSADDGGSRSRRLNFAVAALSYFARTNKRAVLFSMYRRGGAGRSKPGRPISELSDATASVSIVDGSLAIKTHTRRVKKTAGSLPEPFQDGHVDAGEQ